MPEHPSDDRPLFGAPAQPGETRLFPPAAAPRRNTHVPAPAPPTPNTRRVAFDGHVPAPPSGPPPGPMPAPPAAPAVPAQSGGTARTGTVVGVVNGSVTVASTRPDFWGPRILTIVVATALVGSVAQAVVSRRPEVLPSLVLPLLVLAVPLGAAWMALRGRPAKQGTGDRPGVPVRRFRVQSVTGEVVACVLHGDLTGDDIRHGDIVRVTGRQQRGGHYVARHVDVLSSPVGPVISRVSGRAGLGLLAARWGSRLSYVLAALIAVWAVVVLTGLLP